MISTIANVNLYMRSEGSLVYLQNRLIIVKRCRFVKENGAKADLQFSGAHLERIALPKPADRCIMRYRTGFFEGSCPKSARDSFDKLLRARKRCVKIGM